MTRRSPVLDKYFAIVEQQYWAGVAEPTASITAVIAEQNGSLTEWRYTGVLLTLDDAGSYRGDATVAQAVSFLASQRIEIA